MKEREAFSCLWVAEVIKGNKKRVCTKCGKRIYAGEVASIKRYDSDYGEQEDYYHRECALPILWEGICEATAYIKKLNQMGKR